MAEDGPTVLVDEREVIDGSHVKRVRVLRVPRSEKYPGGVKYRMHFGTLHGDTILRYDNAHGIHERHRGEETTKIDFPGFEAIYRRFEREIEEFEPSHCREE